jgi:hypothetical protein
MTNKLKILIIFLLLSFTSLSQIDTNKICFEYSTVQDISRDLIRYDSTIIELEYLRNVLDLERKTLSFKNQQIEILTSKNINCYSMLDSYKEKESIYIKREKELIEINNILTSKNTKLKKMLIITTSTTISLGTIIILSFII